MSSETKLLTFEYPLSLECDLENVELADGLTLRKFDESSRRRILHISNLKWDSEGHALRYQAEENVLNNHLLSPDLDQKVTFYSSNYLLLTKEQSLARDFNFALKLFGHSRSSLFIGYREDGLEVNFFAPPCFFGRKRLNLNKDNLPEFKKVLSSVTSSFNDKKLSLMRDIWMHAMSDAPRIETRFVEVTTLLEMLLLPTQQAELNFRFALRLSKLSGKLGYPDPVEMYAKAKTIYGIRSKIVHSGQSSKLGEYSLETFEIARKLLLLYIQSPEIFAEAALDQLCITS